jgi:UDP:flavonoid glycosyltransferase YjiC (YdhE family)
MDAGHEAFLFCERSSLGIVREHGVAAEALSGDIRSLLPVGRAGADAGADLGVGEMLRIVGAGARLIRGCSAAWTAAVAGHARDADMVLVSGLAAPVGHAVAAALDKPAVHLWLQPTTPTGEFPSAVLPPWRLPGWMNRLSYVVSPNAVLQRLGGRAAVEASVRLFGAASGPAAASASAPGRSRRAVPVVYGFSRHLVKPPGDWRADIRVCGAWALASPHWRPSVALSDFLSAGPAPLYVGFGSVSSFVRRRRLEEIISAIGGRRAVFYPGWSDVTAEMLPDNFFVVGHTSHAWLFPRMSMIIHHCGAGTTHAAAAAGVPSVCLPLGTDQAFWAGRLAAAGVAPAYVPASRIDSRKLTKMIAFAERTDVRDRARALGVAMSTENGVADAVRVIEAELQRALGEGRQKPQ